MFKRTVKELDFDEVIDVVSDNLLDNRSVFMFVHRDAEGNDTPLISLDAQHLVNIINLNLVKRVREYREQLERETKVNFLKGYAPVGMAREIAQTLKLKVLTEDKKKELEQKAAEAQEGIENKVSDYYNAKLILMMPYIVVGVTRQDTVEGVLRVLRDSSGISDKIDVPFASNMVSYTLTSGFQQPGAFEPTDFPEEPRDF